MFDFRVYSIPNYFRMLSWIFIFKKKKTFLWHQTLSSFPTLPSHQFMKLYPIWNVAHLPRIFISIMTYVNFLNSKKCWYFSLHSLAYLKKSNHLLKMEITSEFYDTYLCLFVYWFKTNKLLDFIFYCDFKKLLNVLRKLTISSRVNVSR